MGKGCGRRAWNYTHRSEYWKRVYQKHGFSVEILLQNLSEVCALSFEMALISDIGIENLSNLSGGGLGVSQITEQNRHLKSSLSTGKNNPSFDKAVYDFWHEAYGRVKCTKFILRQVFGVQSSRLAKVCDERSISTGGWSLHKNRLEPRKKSGPNKKTLETVETYINDDGRVWVGNPFDFRKEFSLGKANVYKMRTGRKTPYKGWRLHHEPA